MIYENTVSTQTILKSPHTKAPFTSREQLSVGTDRSEDGFKKRIQLGREEKRMNVKTKGLNTLFWQMGENNFFPLGRWCIKSGNLR